MEQGAQDFVAVFQAFLEEVVADHRELGQSDGDRALAPVLHGHLGADPRQIAADAERDLTDDDLIQATEEMLGEANSITRSLMGTQ